MKVALLAVALLPACGFRPSAAGDGGNGSGSDRDANLGGEPLPMSEPLSPNCYGTGFTVVCPQTAPTSDYTITTLRSVNTSMGSSDCIALQPTNDAVCVVAGAAVSISSILSAHGSRPLVVLSLSTLDVAGEIDVNSDFLSLGAGGDPSDCAGTAATTGGGGFGGSFGSKGGDGGPTAPPAGVAGTAIVPTTLRGGCPGGIGKDATLQGYAGFGGGAVALIAHSSISVLGTVNASGAAGGGSGGGKNGGGGGGAGGMIVFDGTTLTVGASTHIYANGGGGGGGASMSNGGSVGGKPTSESSGGGGGGGGGNGGIGGDGATRSGNTAIDAISGAAGTSGDGNGGGGGGFGVIRIFTAPLPALTHFSPTPT